MAAQKSTQPYSEPWADEVRAELQQILDAGEELGPEARAAMQDVVASLDEFIADTPALVASLSGNASLDTTAPYPRLCVDGEIMYIAWFGSTHGEVVGAKMPLSMHYAPSVAARVMARVPECNAVNRLMNELLRLDTGGHVMSFFAEGDLYLAGMIIPTLQRVSPEKRYVRSHVTGVLVEVSPASEVTIVPLQ